MSDNTPEVDWDRVVGSDDKPVTTVAMDGNAGGAAFAAPLPDLPRTIGRLPIGCGAKKAVIQLPEATAGVKCAAVFANTSVLSDCGNEAEDVCLPAVHHARPLNDREIEVVFWGKGDRVVKGMGWSTGPYPGGQLTTRSVEFGEPFVEVEVVVSRNIPCGCDGENWASEDYQ